MISLGPRESLDSLFPHLAPSVQPPRKSAVIGPMSYFQFLAAAPVSGKFSKAIDRDLNGTFLPSGDVCINGHRILRYDYALAL